MSVIELGLLEPFSGITAGVLKQATKHQVDGVAVLKEWSQTAVRANFVFTSADVGRLTLHYTVLSL